MRNFKQEFDAIRESRNNLPSFSQYDEALKILRDRRDALVGSNILKSDESKIIIKEKFERKQRFALMKRGAIGKKEFYLFRFQSAVSGQCSQPIRKVDWEANGILPRYAETGGGYPDKLNIVNNYELIAKTYAKDIIHWASKKMEQIDAYYKTIPNWWDTYNAYMESPQWRARRKDRLTMDNYSCQLCGETEGTLHVHHESYDNVGQEPMEDLLTVCKSCHQKLHPYKQI